MRPLTIAGYVLLAAGVIVLILGGVGYTKSRESVQAGPIEIATERKGFVPPFVGVIAVVLGIGLVVAGRRKSS